MLMNGECPIGGLLPKKNIALGGRCGGKARGPGEPLFWDPMGWGGGPPGPTKSAYGHPKMEEGVERVNFVLPPKAAKLFWRIFSAVPPRVV